MKTQFNLLLALLVLIFSQCANKSTENENGEENTEISMKDGYQVFGDLSIKSEGAINHEEMDSIYSSMMLGDTLDVKFSTIIESVCQKKGCWMNVKLLKDRVAFIRFKDYGFFAPMNYAGAEAIIEGKAFIDEVSVSKLQHYAKDAKKSQEEIDAIVEPERTLSFMASGIMLKQNEK